MMGFTSQGLLDLEVQHHASAARGERSAERLAHRNGYRERHRHTDVSTVRLRIPKLHQGRYFPESGD